MSDTPRTDAAITTLVGGVSRDFARQLERDLAAAVARAENAERERDEWGDKHAIVVDAYNKACDAVEQVERERDALRAEKRRLENECDALQATYIHVAQESDDMIMRLRALLREWIDRAEGQKPSRQIVDIISDSRAFLERAR